MNKNKICKHIAATVLGVAVASTSVAQETLRFATTHNPQTHFNREVLTPWAERVTELHGDTVRIQAIQGQAIANQGNIINRVLDNAAQVGWAIHATAPGQFPRSSVTYIPGLLEGADIPNASEIASVALWRTYESGVLDAEYQDIIPLAMVVFPQLDLHLNKEVSSLAEFNGLRLMVGSKLDASVAEQLGALPRTVMPADVYQSLSRGNIDGTFNVWTAFAPFRLGEVTNYHLEMGAGAPTAMLFMSRARFDALPAAAQEAILAESGESISRAVGQVLDRVSQELRQSIEEDESRKLISLSGPDQGALAVIYEGARQEWIEETPNGREVYNAFRVEIDRMRAEMRQ